MANLHNILSDVVLDTTFTYKVVKDIQIQTVVINQANKTIHIEIITEDGASTPTVIHSSGFTRAEIEELMDFLTAAL